MTHSQKTIVTALLSGGSIAHMGKSGIRLRDKDLNPMLKVNAKTFWFLRDIMIRDKKHIWRISRTKVRQLHGRSWIKGEYKRLLVLNK